MRTTPKLAAVLAIGLTASLALTACGSKREETGGPTGDAGGTTDASADDRTAQAKKLLEDAGLTIPVNLPLQYNPDHYGEASDQEYGLIKEQLEATGLFTVDLQATEWVTYVEHRLNDYPAYQLGWFPDFPDADNYLTPFFDKENFLGNRYDSATVQGLLAEERIETDETARVALLEQIQGVLAEDLSTLPLLQGSQIAVTGTDIEGVEKTIDGSFQFRFASFVKGGDNSAKVTVGTTDVVAYLDPAFTYDNGSYVVQANVFPMVMAFQQGNPAPQPSLAESCEFTAEGYEYTCKIRSGLKWANGHTLDANDIKFTYDRQQAIAHPNGPSSLLANLVSTDVTDPLTVVFNLAGPYDVTFPQVLASPVGPVVDDEVFNPTDITPPEEILAANAFAGAYTITTFTAGELIEFAPNPGYDGIQGQVQNGGVVTRYYKEGNNMRLDIESGEIDVVWRSLTATDYAQLETSDKVKVLHGPGGEIRYIVFNLETMPGDTAEQKLAVRQAVALSIDRPALAEQVYQGSYTPLCSYVPDGLPGATQSVCDLYGGE